MKCFSIKNHGNQKCLQQTPQKTQVYCQPTKESRCYDLPLHTHDEDYFHRTRYLKLASGAHTEKILSREMKTIGNLSKNSQKTITKTKCYFSNNFTIHTSYKFKNRNKCLIPKLCNTKTISKKNTTNLKRTISNH